jgi:Tfp pilus assembly protein PilN
MTTWSRRPEPWHVQPGWGIVVDLTPPELLNSRKMRLLRQAVVSALVLLLALAAGAVLLARHQRAVAESELADAQTVTIGLQQQAAKYRPVTQIEASIAEVDAQLTQLLGADVRLDTAMNQMLRKAPTGVSVTSLGITISPTAVADDPGNAVTSLDDTGHRRIGNVTMDGTAPSMDVVSRYVDRLTATKGLLDVVPTSNSRGGSGVQFKITLGLDDQVLTHRFDASKGGK